MDICNGIGFNGVHQSMKFIPILCLALVLTGSLFITSVEAQTPALAFPEAQGFGRFATSMA